MNKSSELINDTMKSILDNTEMFMFIKNIDLIYVGVSKTFISDCACLNSEEDIIGKTDYEVFKDKVLAEKYRRDDESLIKFGFPIDCVESYPDKNGEQRFCHTTKYLIKDDKGKPIGIFGQCYDITDKVKLEKNNIIQQEIINKQTSMFDALRSIGGLVVLINVRENKFHHISGDEFKSFPSEGTLLDFVNSCNSIIVNNKSQIDNSSLLLERINRKLKGRVPVSEELKLKDGNWVKISLIPVEFDGNEVVSCLWSCESISKEMKTREELKNRTEILEALRNVYHICMYWNLVENTYFEVSSAKSSLYKNVPLNGILDSTLSELIEKYTVPEKRRCYKDFFDLKKINDRLKKYYILKKEILTIDNGWMRVNIIPINMDINGNVLSCLFVGEKIEEEKRKELEYKHELEKAISIARTDALTKLYNRGGSEEFIKTLINKGIPGLLCLIDVDDFKKINDNYGHFVGDIVLQQIANSLKKNARQNDILARFGGDEFVVFCPEIDGNEACHNYIDGLFKYINSIKIKNFEAINVTISLGAVYLKDRQKKDFITIYEECDLAMYSCKNSTKKYALLSQNGKEI